MENILAKKLREYITEELEAAEIYEVLAQRAPTSEDSEILLSISEDESRHAKAFQAAYHRLTGKRWSPEIHEPMLDGSFEEIVHERVIDEGEDYRKYMRDYIAYPNNTQLRDAFFLAATDENVHAQRLLNIVV